jgi:hypothetical protein
LGDGIAAAKIEKHSARAINVAGVTAHQHAKQKNTAVNQAAQNQGGLWQAQ